MRDFPIMRLGVALGLLCGVAIGLSGIRAAEGTGEFVTEVRQITTGPEHHFFGYIGHVRTIPWNRSGRYVLSLQTRFQERMPEPGEAAEIVVLDAKHGYAPRVVDRTRVWNPQQGTMLYWNPEAPETEFFFNDRDPQTHEVFCVLFDLSKGKGGERVRSEGIDQGGYTGGNLRIDPSPCWNRDGTQILFAGIAPDAQKTRQLFVMTVRRKTL